MITEITENVSKNVSKTVINICEAALFMPTAVRKSNDKFMSCDAYSEESNDTMCESIITLIGTIAACAIGYTNLFKYDSSLGFYAIGAHATTNIISCLYEAHRRTTSKLDGEKINNTKGLEAKIKSQH